MKRRPLPRVTADGRIIAVMRAASSAVYPRLIEALAAGGVRSVELTLTTPGTLDALPGLVDEWGATVDIGIGTATSPADVRAAADGGASYLVTPHTDPAVLAACGEAGVPFLPGGLTPTELRAGWDAGATAVKVFPAGQVGPGYLRELRGPFPDIDVVPSGGVDLETGRRWLEAGAMAISVGGPLLQDVETTQDFRALRRRAEAFAALAARSTP